MGSSAVNAVRAAPRASSWRPPIFALLSRTLTCVNREEAHSVDEVQRFYMLLRPLDSGERGDGGGKAEEAEEAEGKLLPTTSHRSRPHWGYVDAVSPHVKDIRAALEGDTYETKTRGTQHVAAARAAAAGRYLITQGGAEQAAGREGVEGGEGEQAGGKEKGAISKGSQGKSAEQVKEEQAEEQQREQQKEKKREEEKEQESPQEAFNIEREASYVLQVKNPLAPSRPPYLARPSVRLQAFPPPLQHRLNGLRFAPADPPAFLDHPGCEVLLIAASDDLQREFGGEVQRDLAVGEGERGVGGVEGGEEGELGGEESGYGSGCEGDEWMGFVREGLGWRSEELVKPLEAGEWA
ncbi:unnamed protein product [Closterium sp. Yama58-4]|nr:unnamed protein product [Closterium sp. Yama58-4]